MQVYRNRSVFLNTILFLIVLIPALSIDSIYAAIGQEETVAKYATEYVYIVFPFLWFDFVNWSYMIFSMC